MSISRNENARVEAGVPVEGWQAKSTNQNRHEEFNTDVLKSKSTSTETQLKKLVALLRTGPQTTYSLRANGIAQAARIWDLRQEGYVVATELVTAFDSDGFMHARVAMYTLLQEPPQQTDLPGVANE